MLTFAQRAVALLTTEDRDLLKSAPEYTDEEIAEGRALSFYAEERIERGEHKGVILRAYKVMSFDGMRYYVAEFDPKKNRWVDDSLPETRKLFYKGSAVHQKTPETALAVYRVCRQLEVLKAEMEVKRYQEIYQKSLELVAERPVESYLDLPTLVDDSYQLAIADILR